MNIKKYVEHKARSAKQAAGALYNCTTKEKNLLLGAIIRGLGKNKAEILRANAIDLKAGEKAGLSSSFLDRLALNEKRIQQMQDGTSDVIKLPDPVGEIIRRIKRPNGLKVMQMRVPLGAVGIIYEARPNVTIDASVLCLKAGNSVLLRGGSEAVNSNRALVSIIKSALKASGLPEGCVEFIDTTDRKAVFEMLKQDKYLDVIIPRGTQALIKLIIENSSVPVIAHGEGNCHVFVDSSADLKMAEDIIFNAKVSRPSVCNAAEKLLVHAKIAKKFLPSALQRLSFAGVEIRADRKTVEKVRKVDEVKKVIKKATEADWYKEYSDLIIGVKVVKDINEAIRHINHYGSHHTDAIVTSNKANAGRFLREIDSAAVFVNASTRFTDGYEFGLGAEIGISTQKLHARGPMGLNELTCAKFVVEGKGQIRR